MMSQLEARESLTAITVAQMGAGVLKEADARTVMRMWRSLAGMERPAPKASKFDLERLGIG